MLLNRGLINKRSHGKLYNTLSTTCELSGALGSVHLRPGVHKGTAPRCRDHRAVENCAQLAGDLTLDSRESLGR